MEIKKPSTVASILIWICVTLFCSYQYALRPLPNIIMPNLMIKYGITASDFGFFSTVYYAGYIAAHIPIGILLSRIGGKIILPLAIISTALGLVPLAYSDSWSMVIIGRCLTGIGSAGSVVGAMQIYRILYPEKFSLMLGITVSLALLTAVYGGATLGYVVEIAGMAVTVNALLYSGIILSIVTYFLMPKMQSESSDANISDDVKSVFCNYKLLFVSLMAGLMVGPMEGFADAWGSAYMVNVYEIPKFVADGNTASIFFGMCAGCIILPYIAEKNKFYIGTTIVSAIGMMVCFVLMLGKYINPSNLYYLCVIIGIFCAYQVVIVSKAATFVSKERSGTAAAVANMIIMGVGAFFHTSIGMIIDNSWDGKINNSIKIYNPDAYTNAIYVIPIALSFAIIGLMMFVIINFIRARSISQKTVI